MAEPVTDCGRWLPEARAGSHEALGQALEACRAYLLLIANQQIDPHLRAKGGASDLVQETFLEAQRDFTHFQGDGIEQFQAWLRAILLNNVRNFTRHYYADKRELGREVRLEPETPSANMGQALPAETPSPSARAIAKEDASRVVAALERMPPDYRQVIALRNQEGRSFAEVATILARSENAVRKLWFRAIERLREELGALP
jgi:RNA polymerase sigma-70 factor (ECF subfamily)